MTPSSGTLSKIRARAAKVVGEQDGLGRTGPERRWQQRVESCVTVAQQHEGVARILVEQRRHVLSLGTDDERSAREG